MFLTLNNKALRLGDHYQPGKTILMLCSKLQLTLPASMINSSFFDAEAGADLPEALSTTVSSWLYYRTGGLANV